MGRLRFCSHCCHPAALFAVDLVQGLEEKTSSLLFKAMQKTAAGFLSPLSVVYRFQGA